jgi:hypothetical protein
MRWKGFRVESHLLLYRGAPALILLISIAVWLVFPLASAVAAPTVPAIPASASCARLAQADPTATNGPNWGATLLPGLGATGGWFGVPVCANSVNQVAPGGANVSCDRTPANFARSGCAPGRATSDGYGLTFQCVELVARFAAWAFGVSPGAWHGDAPYLWLSGNHPTSFRAFANGGTRAPMPGDVLVWGSLDRHGRPWPSGPAGGHVAVVSAVGAGWISFVEENMLGRHGNIPKETTTLTENNGHWTIGPTYGTNGGRALYGWLHSSQNTGHFPRSSAPSAGAPTLPATPSAQPSTSSLAQGVIVTGAGALAEIVWADTHTPYRPETHGQAGAKKGATPEALVESLGAPPGVLLAPNQAPAVVTLPTGERYSFARGQDGRLYAAYTAPNTPGALWQALGAPTGVDLISGATALWDGENVVVGALGSDGALWVRSGPAGMLDSWVSLGRPANTIFQGTPALIRAPGSSAHSAIGSAYTDGTVAWVALALGQDGALYEADWRASGPSTTTPSATPQTSSPSHNQAPGWGAWASVAAPDLTTTSLSGELLALPEIPQTTTPQPASAAPATGTVDALATDANGHLWLLRRATMAQSWQARAISLPDARSTLISAALSPNGPQSRSASGSAALQVYLTDPQANTSQSTTQQAGSHILTGSLSLSSGSASRAPTWKTLGALSSLAPAGAASAATGAPVALSFGPGVSALLTAQGARVTLTGDQTALQFLAPGAKVTSSPSMRDAGTVVLGLLAAPQSFSDAFTASAPDSRWVMLGESSAAARETAGALTLSAPTPSGITVATQGAPSGAFTVTVRVTPDASWRAGTQAGILLALDDWNALTLSMRPDGTVTLCPIASGKALPCNRVTAPTVTTPSPGLYLRISQSGADLMGAASADGVNWTAVGSWRPSWLPSAETSPAGAYAPPVALTDPADLITAPSGDLAAPLVFTSLGLFVENGAPHIILSQQARSSARPGAPARFSDLSVTPSAPAAQ